MKLVLETNFYSTKLGHAVRQKRGFLSLRAAAEKCGVPFATILRVEKGQIPYAKNYAKLMIWLNLPKERFAEFTDPTFY